MTTETFVTLNELALLPETSTTAATMLLNAEPMAMPRAVLSSPSVSVMLGQQSSTATAQPLPS